MPTRAVAPLTIAEGDCDYRGLSPREKIDSE